LRGWEENQNEQNQSAIIMFPEYESEEIKKAA
jgi:hypothetical protein